MRFKNTFTVKPIAIAVALFGSSLGLAGCAGLFGGDPYAEAFSQMMKTSFRSQGIAAVERLDQDKANQACSSIDGADLPEKQAKAIEAVAYAAVKMPASGKFIGDWKEGERLAQNGRGMTWTDASAETKNNGGNCYNCHRISGSELSYGTIGPSLYQYGKLRGVKDANSPDSKPIVEYTWAKIYNAKAFNACSGMPRFGHAGLLDEKQMQDIMALLLDPASPVNQ